MIPENVTLIVKAPNQQVDDQSVQCCSSWTVLQLKGHLSQVYPSKPRAEEQKIIYSGQLLEDNTVLKDVLRTYDSQIAHTMHLVCTPNRRLPETKSPQTPAHNPDIESDGLRRRTVEASEPVPRPEIRQNDQNHTVEMQNYLSSLMSNYGRVGYPGYTQRPADPAQLVMMHQAYMQYMQQYANMWQAAAPAPAAPAPAAAPAEARDWLEHVYVASRLAVLCSLVYLYGSGARLLLVALLALVAYLHQIGFFRELNLNNRLQQADNPAVDNQQPAGNQPAGNQPAGNQPAGNQPAGNQPAGNQPAGNQPADNQPADNQPAPEQPDNTQPTLLGVTWMIFTSFFASLIPDVNQ